MNPKPQPKSMSSKPKTRVKRLPIKLGFKLDRIYQVISQDDIVKIFETEKPDKIAWGHDIPVPDGHLYIDGELVYSLPKVSKSK